MSFSEVSSHSREDFLAFEGVHEILNSIVIPRPIAFITSRGENGVINAAPFSYFNIVCSKPSIVSIAIEWRRGERKDTSKNISFLKEFVVNICQLEMAPIVSLASKEFASNVSEIDMTNLTLLPSEKISVPRIANTPVQIECRLHRFIEIVENQCDLILGEVVKMHLHKDILNENGQVSPGKLNPLARICGSTYAKVTDFFEIPKI